MNTACIIHRPRHTDIHKKKGENDGWVEGARKGGWNKGKEGGIEDVNKQVLKDFIQH